MRNLWLGLIVLMLSSEVCSPSRAQETSWGNFKGRIVVKGTVAPPKKLNPDKDREICLRDGDLLDETVMVADDGGLRDVYVMLYLDRDEAQPPIHPSYEASFKQPVELDNKGCRFIPHAAFVRVGQTLEMKNSDPVGHNIHTLNRSEKNKNVPAGGTVDVTYDEADRIPADVECNIHTFMKGLLLVRENPYVAITNDKGEFMIENVPAGNWKFQFWHKKVGYLKMLTRDGKEFLGRRGEAEFKIEDGKTNDVGDLVLQAEVLNADD